MGFQTKMPIKEEVLATELKRDLEAASRFELFLKVQKEVHFLRKKVNEKKGSSQGLRSIRHKQPLRRSQ